VHAEKPKAASNHPIKQRRLLEITDAIDVERYPVMAEQDLVSRFCMDGVSVVE
jgi:hypothetical protein